MSEAGEDGMGVNGGCGLFMAELDAYLEGESRPTLESHASVCPRCGAVLADISLIRSTASGLAVEEPPARLWLNIRATLVEEGIIRAPETFWQRWFASSNLVFGPAAAAAAVMVVLAAVVVKESRLLFPPPATPAAASAVGANPVLGQLEEMELSYRAEANSLQPSLRATYEKGLESLDDEISDLSDSVRRNPSDTLARDYLNAAYAQKAQVLEAALNLGDR